MISGLNFEDKLLRLRRREFRCSPLLTHYCILISNKNKFLFVFALRMHYHDIHPLIFFSWYPCEDICAINSLRACLGHKSSQGRSLWEWFASLSCRWKIWVTSYMVKAGFSSFEDSILFFHDLIHFYVSSDVLFKTTNQKWLLLPSGLDHEPNMP